MKKDYFLLVIFILFYLSVKSQNSKSFITLPIDYCISNEAPKLFKFRDTIMVNCDSVYIINKIRYKFYKDLHASILEDNNIDINSLLQAYENRLNEHESAYNKLLTNNKKIEKISLGLIEDTQKSLEDTQKTLVYTQQTLEHSMKSLEHARDLIRNEKWNSSGKKILVGMAGICIGTLVGVVAIK